MHDPDDPRRGVRPIRPRAAGASRRSAAVVGLLPGQRAARAEATARRRSSVPASPRPYPTARLVKDVVEVVAATVTLLVLSPLLAAVSIWILATDGRPVLFLQQRAGRDGVPFRMWKFRTMVNDAIRIGQRLHLTEDPFGLIEDDPRVTRCGRLLRRTSLDELPQLINVVRGEMSLVGPRPDVLPQVAHYTPADQRRLDVKPGITGWAQVNGRDQLTWPERFQLDRWYVANWSLWLDCKILWLTLASIGCAESPAATDEFNIRRRQGVNGA
jgi:lipopolysaccharide/colanic/teichoic acid biosynthesis glycosyltransferase